VTGPDTHQRLLTQTQRVCWSKLTKGSAARTGDI
jgi:hypothetical protein